MKVIYNANVNDDEHENSCLFSVCYGWCIIGRNFVFGGVKIGITCVFEKNFLYLPTAPQKENETFENVVILHCQKNDNEDENEDCYPETRIYSVDCCRLSVDKRNKSTNP